MQTWFELSEDEQEAYILVNYNDLRTQTEAIATVKRRYKLVGALSKEKNQLGAEIIEMEKRRVLIQAKYDARTAIGVMIRPPNREEIEAAQERAENTASLLETSQDVADAISFSVAALEFQQAIQFDLPAV